MKYAFIAVSALLAGALAAPASVAHERQMKAIHILYDNKNSLGLSGEEMMAFDKFMTSMHRRDVAAGSPLDGAANAAGDAANAATGAVGNAANGVTGALGDATKGVTDAVGGLTGGLTGGKGGLLGGSLIPGIL